MLPKELREVGVTEEEWAATERHGLVTHPGEYIREILEELEWSSGQLARTLGVPRNRITLILNGQRGISADTALRLSRWLGTTPDIWLNLQNQYELDLARLADDDTYAAIEPLEAVTA